MLTGWLLRRGLARAEPSIHDPRNHRSDQRCHPEHPELGRGPVPKNRACPLERAGLTDVFVIGIIEYRRGSVTLPIPPVTPPHIECGACYYWPVTG